MVYIEIEHELTTYTSYGWKKMAEPPKGLISSGRNKLFRACCHQAVNNLLRPDDINLLEQTCSKAAVVQRKTAFRQESVSFPMLLPGTLASRAAKFINYATLLCEVSYNKESRMD